jgi:uncharacterized repeat protein (TIGR04076 family)
MEDKKKKKSHLNLDTRNMTDADYREFTDNLGKIEIKLVEKIGQCFHNLGDTYVYSIPYKRPEKVCYALLHVLELYNWRVALGVPSWNAGDRDVYRVHCPDRTGTVWEMRRLE